jgi:hypothetical protein
MKVLYFTTIAIYIFLTVASAQLHASHHAEHDVASSRGIKNYIRQRLQQQVQAADDDYADFAEVPQFLRRAYDLPSSIRDDQLVDILMPSPKKRYLGIDIPDYISASGKSDAIKSMSEKMKSLGRK